VEGFIPSWRDSSAKQFWFESNINRNRRIVVTPAGGDKPHPYKSHPIADADIIDRLLDRLWGLSKPVNLRDEALTFTVVTESRDGQY